MSRARRTNWIGRLSFNNITTTAGSTTTVELLDASDSSDEISNYIDPTLIRIRGQIICDPEWSSSVAGSKWFYTFLVIGFGQTPIEVNDSTDLSSDRILWTDYHAAAHHLALSSTGYASNVDQALRVSQVDCKAMRKFGDDQKLWLSIYTESASEDVKVHYALRMLVKE